LVLVTLVTPGTTTAALPLPLPLPLLLLLLLLLLFHLYYYSLLQQFQAVKTREGKRWGE
jgi:hypothetical protein